MQVCASTHARARVGVQFPSPPTTTTDTKPGKRASGMKGARPPPGQQGAESGPSDQGISHSSHGVSLLSATVPIDNQNKCLHSI